VTIFARTVLAVAIAAVGLVGIAIVTVRLAGEVSGVARLIGGSAALAGVAAFFVFQQLARQPWARDSVVARKKGWLFVAALVAAPLWARLPSEQQLPFLAAGAGYLVAVLAFVARRLLKVRAARASPHRDANGAEP